MIKVSIICNAYNHGRYIRDALESFVNQRTNFKYEILVHDDASTDDTAQVIKEYENKYPDLIKPIYQTENQYSQKKGINKTYQYPRVKGEYIAICEGDDYWTDMDKLQKQYDAMEKHPEIDMCAHRAVSVNAETKKKIREYAPADKDTVLSTSQVILGGGGYVATNSLFFRKRLIEAESEFRKMFAIDYTLQIMGSLAGGILYLNDCMSAYRVLSKNSWTSVTYRNPKKYGEHIGKMIKMLETLNEETNGKYDNEVQEKILEYHYERAKAYGSKDIFLNKKYRAYLKKETLTKKIKLAGKVIIFLLKKRNFNG